VTYMLLAMLAALSFTTGGVFMKHADGLRHPAPVLGFVVLFAAGAMLQSQAMRGAELGATYILVLGLEAALAFGLGIVLFDEAATLRKVAAVMLIVAGIALLRSR
jgi:multidrug transporter EmrE-like cation transporter